MIGYLSGEILETAEGKLLVGVGSRNAGGVVGYTVSVPAQASYHGFLPGQTIQLFIYTHVREEAFDLYGFQSLLEKNLFLTLLAVNGIGPKSALGILSAVTPDDLIQAITREDKAFLTQIPGIGKKTAERVVVELRDTVKKKMEAGQFPSSRELKRQSTLPKGEFLAQEGVLSMDHRLVQDAKSALVSLGYKEQEVQQLLGRILKNPDFHPERAEDLIRIALKQVNL